MSCFLVLNSFAGNDQEAAAKKLALIFRMAPQEASSILEKVTQGQGWSTPREVSDQQAAVAENYLKGIGFQVERSGQQAVVDQIAGTVAVEEAPLTDDIGSIFQAKVISWMPDCLTNPLEPEVVSVLPVTEGPPILEERHRKKCR